MKYSVILPVRNGGEYVKLCVNSILLQTLQDFDLLVLDNCSTDGTTEWIQSLGDNRIKLYRAEKPLTIEENWSRVVQVTKNEFMTLIGHDDILEPGFLKEMDDLIAKHPGASLYTSQFHYIDSAGNISRESKSIKEVEDGASFLQSLLKNEADIMGTGFVMRSADYDRIGGIPMYPNLLFADFELWHKLTNMGYKVSSPKHLFSFRVHSSTTTVSPDTKFQLAFEQLISYLATLKKDKASNDVILKYAIGFIRHYCKSLAHRLLRTDKEKRGGLTVRSFIAKCKSYADMLVPGNDFQPEDQLSVKAAKWFDSSNFSRSLFLMFKKIYSKPVMK